MDAAVEEERRRQAEERRRVLELQRSQLQLFSEQVFACVSVRVSVHALLFCSCSTASCRSFTLYLSPSCSAASCSSFWQVSVCLSWSCSAASCSSFYEHVSVYLSVCACRSFCPQTTTNSKFRPQDPKNPNHEPQNLCPKIPKNPEL
jgi:hypothetical protein